MDSNPETIKSEQNNEEEKNENPEKTENNIEEEKKEEIKTNELESMNQKEDSNIKTDNYLANVEMCLFLEPKNEARRHHRHCYVMLVFFNCLATLLN